MCVAFGSMASLSCSAGGVALNLENNVSGMEKDKEDNQREDKTHLFTGGRVRWNHEGDTPMRH